VNPRGSLHARAALLGSLALLAEGIVPARASAPAAGQDAVLLEERLDIEIVSPTLARVSYLNRTRVLTERGVDRFGQASIYYNPSIAIRDLRAAVVSPEGKRAEVRKQSIFDGAAFASYELYSDTKHRSVSFAGASPGATLEYSYEEEVRNLFYLQGHLDFPLQEEIAVQSKTLTVRAPASFGLSVSVRGAPEYTREEDHGAVTHRWRVHDVPALGAEDDMPPVEDVVPRVRVLLKQIVWGERTIDTSNWNGIAHWQWDLARDRMEPSPEVAEKASALTGGLSDPAAKARRLYEFVQGKVSYVAIELGIGGFQPHDNASVMRHSYGDCKDKATLLIAMLRSVGLRGDPVLILTRDEGLTDRESPSIAFNHVIVAMPGRDGYLFMDPTSENTAFGDLPWTDQGANVLIVKEDGTGDLVQTPVFPAERNRTRWTVSASVGANGDLEGSYSLEAWGQERAEFSGFVAGTKPTEREDALARFMTRICTGAVLLAQEVRPPSGPDEPIGIAIRFSVPRFLVRAGTMEIVSPHLVRFPSLTRIAAAPSRMQAVFFDYLFNETSEVRLLLPPGRSVKKVPAGGAVEGPGLSATTTYAMDRFTDRNVLVVKRSVSVSRREIPAADYSAFRRFVSALTEEEARGVTLQAGME